MPLTDLWDKGRWSQLPEKLTHMLVILPPGDIGTKLFSDLEEHRGNMTPLHDSPELWTQARALGVGESGTPAKSSMLFSPCSYLEDNIALIEDALKQKGIELTCLDVGCGSGRDAVWLATGGWQVTGIDSLGKAAQRAKRLGEAAGVDHLVTTAQGEIKSTTGCLHMASGSMCALPCLPHGIGPNTPEDECPRFGLVLVVRFLERASFGTLERLVHQAGGILLHFTFVQEPDGDWPWPSPRNPAKILARGELAEWFGSRDWEVLRDEVVRMSDGRPMSGFVAQRKGSTCL
ncbi:unnamed protein product [Chrysoparadoxa australica]